MKSCSTCGAVKALEEFQVRRASSDGRTASCKKCLSERDAARANLPHRVAARKACKATDHGKAAHNRSVASYRRRSREKVAAHNAINKALIRGHIKRWPCQVCGDAESQAHHPDYQNRLGVVWLCDNHHKEAHRATKECDEEFERNSP